MKNFKYRTKEPMCMMQEKTINEQERISSLRGHGYDNIVEDGVRNGLSAEEIAINIYKAMPQGDIERSKAINLLVEAGQNVMNKYDTQEQQSNNASSKKEAVNLLIEAAKRLV